MLPSLETFLKKQGICVKADKEMKHRSDIIYSALPKWLSDQFKEVEKYYAEYYADIIDWTNSDVKNILKQKIKEDFRCVKKPPRWIQSSNWVIGDNGPYVFIGQLDMGDLLHDTSQLYVFMDFANGDIQVITQSY